MNVTSILVNKIFWFRYWSSNLLFKSISTQMHVNAPFSQKSHTSLQNKNNNWTCAHFVLVTLLIHHTYYLKNISSKLGPSINLSKSKKVKEMCNHVYFVISGMKEFASTWTIPRQMLKICDLHCKKQFFEYSS